VRKPNPKPGTDEKRKPPKWKRHHEVFDHVKDQIDGMVPDHEGYTKLSEMTAEEESPMQIIDERPSVRELAEFEAARKLMASATYDAEEGMAMLGGAVELRDRAQELITKAEADLNSAKQVIARWASTRRGETVQ
jgi:hypothetical protein